jgi:hypothetical protein
MGSDSQASAAGGTFHVEHLVASLAYPQDVLSALVFHVEHSTIEKDVLVTNAGRAPDHSTVTVPRETSCICS